MIDAYSGLRTTKSDIKKVSEIYESHYNLQKESGDIRTPIIKSAGGKICENCTKEDVCKYKEECIKAVKDILHTGKRKNAFINTEINCNSA